MNFAGQQVCTNFLGYWNRRGTLGNHPLREVMKRRVLISLLLVDISEALLRDPENLFLNTFFHPAPLELFPAYDIFPSMLYVRSPNTPNKPPPPPRDLRLLTPDIEQYEGERYFKAQRSWNHQLNVNALVGYSEQLSGQALAYTAAANQRSRTPQERHYGVLGYPPRLNTASPRYRYTQVGLTYGRREDFHHKDGGYGPYDPHGLLEYRALEMRNQHTLLQRSRAAS